MQEAQGLVPEQKWHISVSLGSICLKLLSQALGVFPQYPNTYYAQAHTHSPKRLSYSWFNWFSTPGNRSKENFQLWWVEGENKSNRFWFLNIKTRAALGNKTALRSNPCRLFFPSKIKAIQDYKENKEKIFLAASTESKRHLLRGGVWRGWREEASWLHHLSVLLLPLDQVSTALYSSAKQQRSRDAIL